MSETLVQPVTLSDKAVKRIAAILAKAPDANSLRVSVEGGGCSGFSYKYDLTSETEASDLVLERDGARVVIDETSVVYLDGSVIDFVDDLMGQSFQVRNPNAVASCGCGTSFSI
ncbi:iron-sulfur cluster assembly accessory protein [Fulvimarina endophytica]|uniref:Iron-sulfur cluster assembly accessory protein n=1 Tax=Fulvimarina endophytica TaxID=2293836 RepID=A0A371XBF6_9HYPH|nr:iron-sulfur cluster assembly accessory protein [Fulvimarina endophytica]RFC66575.1 iron-sulfur cluster assembly accessory protein [Fulvimarina endophytica]